MLHIRREYNVLFLMRSVRDALCAAASKVHSINIYLRSAADEKSLLNILVGGCARVLVLDLICLYLFNHAYTVSGLFILAPLGYWLLCL
jgi:hypothetical protein